VPRSLLAVIVDCQDAYSQAKWWAGILDQQVSERNTEEYEVTDPSTGDTPLYFMNVPEGKVVKNRMHVDVITDGPLEDDVSRLIAAGATLVELRQDPPTLANPDTLAIMQDPEGNEFCLLSAGTVTGMLTA
jgi:Glyoxalase-like domain